MSGEEAERWGFYNKLWAPEALLADVTSLAASLAPGPTYAHAMTKRCIQDEWNMGVDASIDHEAKMQAICMETMDFERAYEAFAAKQKPVFKGD